MKILKTQLHLGLAQPVRILQISDCHLSACSEEDSDAVKAKAKSRTDAFLKDSGGVPQEKRLQEALNLADDCDALVFTGDIADSPSQANLHLLQHLLEGRRYLYTFGNHDYYPYDSDDANEEDRERFLDDFLRFLPCDPLMDSMQLEGVNLVALDDSLAQFSQLQLDFLKAELQRGLPILLFLHLPLYSPNAANRAYERFGSCMSVGTPEEVLAAHGELNPKMQASEATKAVLELIETEPLIKAVFASHLHFCDEAEAFGKPQFVNEPCYLGSVREIELI